MGVALGMLLLEQGWTLADWRRLNHVEKAYWSNVYPEIQDRRNPDD